MTTNNANRLPIQSEFDTWMNAYDADMHKYGVEGSYTREVAPAVTYREQYEAGDTPEEAAAEERSYWEE